MGRTRGRSLYIDAYDSDPRRIDAYDSDPRSMKMGGMHHRQEENQEAQEAQEPISREEYIEGLKQIRDDIKEYNSDPSLTKEAKAELTNFYAGEVDKLGNAYEAGKGVSTGQSMSSDNDMEM